MRIHVTARHCDLDPEDRLFAERRLEKLARFARDIQEAHVIVSSEKYRHTAEITLRVRGHDVASREEATEPRIAIDLAADRIEHQIRRLKERQVEHRRARPEVEGLGRDAEDGEDGEPSGNGASEV